MSDTTAGGAVPIEAVTAMQAGIWEDCIRPGENEWTTWTDSILLAETAARALAKAGWRVLPPTVKAPVAKRHSGVFLTTVWARVPQPDERCSRCDASLIVEDSPDA